VLGHEFVGLLEDGGIVATDVDGWGRFVALGHPLVPLTTAERFCPMLCYVRKLCLFSTIYLSIPNIKGPKFLAQKKGPKFRPLFLQSNVM
jgi:hypothetical protein